MTNLIKHQDELEEDYRLKDLLNREDKILDYSINKLDHIQKSWIVWLIWPFWCWKTTFINQIVEKENKIDSWTKWLNFDAWKYPDRKDLRENFILDMAEKLDKKWEDLVVKGLKWQSTSIFEAILKDGWNYIDKFIPNIRKYLFNREKRELHIIESLLKEIFIALHVWENWSVVPTIFIVIEDIDRSWDAWVYFLQTLNYFLKNINLWEWLQVIAIATIWNIEYRWNLDSYLKCLDYIHYFPITNFKYKPMLIHFIDEKCRNDSLEQFVDYLWENYEWFTPRTLKHILRDLWMAFDEFLNNDLTPLLQKSLTLFWVIAAKYINISENDKRKTLIDKWRQKWVIDEPAFKSFFLSIVTWESFLIQPQRWVYKLLESGVHNESVLDYCFANFWDDDDLIKIQQKPWTANVTVYVNRKLLSI